MSEDAHRTLPDVVRSVSTVTSDLGPAVVVAVSGELDLLEAPHLMTLLDTELARPELALLVVDLADVEFLGSSGLGVLANIATRAIPPPGGASSGRPAPQVRLVAPPDHRPVVHPWEMMNLQEIVRLFPDVPAALRADPET
jgi:anti-sigma B factor antagonist